MYIIEGANGAGKTSLIEILKSRGYQTLSSPNGTPLARELRSACRGTAPWEDIDKRVQFMLFSATRLDEYIRCIHGKEEIVVVDRWWTSTYIYQCILQGMSVDFLEHTIHPEEKIDLVILLDGDDDVLMKRVKAERAKNPEHGNCRWTQEETTMKKLMRLYREDLPTYLNSKSIPNVTIDTTQLTQDEVVDLVEGMITKKMIKEVSNGNA